MRGIITKANNQLMIGKIADGNGTEYFFHYSNFPKKSVRKGYVVEFDAFNEGKRCLRAVNIKLVSYGIHHPFCNPILNICRFIEENTSDSVEKGYKLRELQMLYNYFVDIEDTDVHDLRRKYKPETYTLDTNIKNKEG